MKVIIENGDTRIVRYGVSDVSERPENIVFLNYAPQTVDRTDAPSSESFTGTLTGSADSAIGNDARTHAEDVEMEREAADDLRDYSLQYDRTETLP